MTNDLIKILADAELAWYIQKASALRSIPRKVGGNNFRHVLYSFNIMLDYEIFDVIALKAAIIHDVLEDVPNFVSDKEILNIDEDGKKVLELVRALTFHKDKETKSEYLTRLLEENNPQCLKIKICDRIANLIEINTDIYSEAKIEKKLMETEDYILPMAEKIKNQEMVREIKDLISSRREFIRIRKTEKT
ncbi:MAG: hypothetical protein A2161_14205 [Candidatus Schekmanbacteria bacterium RBG_13_48_7]|uniref:HD/PDEase domain-containing protein n=1 Tax=Candidatus Schekmanbacteria bacterium RBG_13_48_7 TaxID=1817878 RepID=A0A1F7S0C7_9BACT|nr:MAG: hypothetical protein A2161_14205 [Candidatus Schekmanbacteria bacterium RBG_13_48_7]